MTPGVKIRSPNLGWCAAGSFDARGLEPEEGHASPDNLGVPFSADTGQEAEVEAKTSFSVTRREFLLPQGGPHGGQEHPREKQRPTPVRCRAVQKKKSAV